MKYSIATSALLLASTVVAVDHQVAVGPGLAYTPDTIEAAEGDTVSVTWGSNHDLTQGAFDSPCAPLSGGIYSGMPQAGQTFTFSVNDTSKPMWFYCSVGMHCQSGMALVVNPTTEKTLDAYKQAAASTSSSSAPEGGEVTGGSFDGASATESTSPSGSSSGTSSTSSPTSSGNAANNLIINSGLVGGLIAGVAALAL